MEGPQVMMKGADMAAIKFKWSDAQMKE